MSPRRSELLQQLGLQFSVKAADIDEMRDDNEDGYHYVTRMAEQKALTVFNQLDSRSEVVVIGADTCIVSGSSVLGKPKHEVDARKMLKHLSGRSHLVLTAVSVVVERIGSLQPIVTTKISESKVEFRVVTDEEIMKYWETGEPADKAGAYAIQGRAAIFIKAIQGSYSGIVGLPLFETAELLREYDIQILTTKLCN